MSSRFMHSIGFTHKMCLIVPVNPEYFKKKIFAVTYETYHLFMISKTYLSFSKASFVYKVHLEAEKNVR
jgi:hypothetical protein